VLLKKSHVFSSESVSEGHPDKVADQISDAVLDAALDQDPASRVACETLITRGLVVVAGEISTEARLDIDGIIRGTIAGIGYTDRASGFDLAACRVENVLGRQSPEIRDAVSRSNGETARATKARCSAMRRTRSRSLCLCPYPWPTNSSKRPPISGSPGAFPGFVPTGNPR